MKKTKQNKKQNRTLSETNLRGVAGGYTFDSGLTLDPVLVFDPGRVVLCW